MAQILMNVWTVHLTTAAVSDINVVIIHKVPSSVYAKKVSTLINSRNYVRVGKINDRI